ncbi:uncharacterized protein PGTG_07191 [Puccinia graminis f. sp. tritici CRL 75-36-700-3]|uniref:Lipoprotein n=1 Tax=Puccinia graminis f. sp. tritici (strain CRL 75-36-700-3 / race SCCL) TaxID=418459 RepID=E3K9S6_PUCGT|nr:uncharacterized protein PGTG_07191 [Puccinia graminis f. sp. tritici CRL 75-36-700-3]EFP80939.1 hypothetical protein PGTG_07191 [Puccinia graminis f. sp. tritici CRL 75-36-700-3]
MKPARFLLALSLLQGCHGTQLPNRGLSQADVPTTAQSAVEFANLVVDHFTSDHNPYLKARVQTGIINHRHPAVLSTLDSQGTSTVTIHHQQIININEVESRIENQRGITCTSQVADQLQQAMH